MSIGNIRNTLYRWCIVILLVATHMIQLASLTKKVFVKDTLPLYNPLALTFLVDKIPFQEVRPKITI